MNAQELVDLLTKAQKELRPLPDDGHIDVFQVDRVTVVRVQYAITSPGGTRIAFEGMGQAIRHPGDDGDDITGFMLAASRAFRTIARGLNKRARSRVEVASAFRREQEEAKQKAREQSRQRGFQFRRDRLMDRLIESDIESAMRDRRPLFPGGEGPTPRKLGP